MEDKYDTVKLLYTIHKFSSYNANYVPENITVNSPSDQLSRWFTDIPNPSQYIILKLTTPAVVETIKFGKYIKAHVSDLKKFQIFGGIDDNNLSLLFSGGLKKDGTAETFRLRNRTVEGLYLPIQYIKIEPMQSWGPPYSFSIWYVELQGKNQEELISSALDTINLRKEEEAVRILLKHLRRRRYKDAFEALSRESGVRLEGPIQARLWNALVENGDYKLAEEILEEAKNEGEFDWYMSWQPYTPVWRQMSACSAAVEAALCCERSPTAAAQDQCCDHEARPEDLSSPATADSDAEKSYLASGSPCCGRPGPRGGHQLVVDSVSGTLYLFGGWNGTEDLDDLWAFDTVAERWSLLCRHSGSEGGPSPRSCHKMVFDPVHRKLYTLGRYLDNAQRVPSNMNSDLYSYDVSSNTWSLVCSDTALVGGPRLVFDHQMCIDPDTQTIYVFGGRVLPANTEEVAQPAYSGLYAYYITAGTWQLLLPDRHELDAPQPRVSHSMLFHPIQRRLYMFAGQRNKQHLADLWWWDVGLGRGGALCRGATAPPPAAGFTQRATLDPDQDEIYVLSGMSKEKDKRVYNTLWVFSLNRASWSCVYRNDAVTPAEPRPRFAHQLVYDPVKKIHYLFGGNPGNQSSPRLRLDDLWALQLSRPTVDSVWRTARAALREARYKALCAAGEDKQALEYLRKDLSEVIDHSDQEQVTHFHKLATVLFSGRSAAGPGCVPAALAGVALTPRRARGLARRRARPPDTNHLAQALAQVLGAEDSLLEPQQPFEQPSPPAPECWDVGEDADEEPPSQDWIARDARLRLYDELCRYFRPSVVPPKQDVGDLVAIDFEGEREPQHNRTVDPDPDADPGDSAVDPRYYLPESDGDACSIL